MAIISNQTKRKIKNLHDALPFHSLMHQSLRASSSGRATNTKESFSLVIACRLFCDPTRHTHEAKRQVFRCQCSTRGWRREVRASPTTMSYCSHSYSSYRALNIYLFSAIARVSRLTCLGRAETRPSDDEKFKVVVIAAIKQLRPPFPSRLARETNCHSRVLCLTLRPSSSASQRLISFAVTYERLKFSLRDPQL